MKILIVLQNPWAKGRLKEGFNPARWRAEFLASRTGKRLIRLFGSSKFNVVNANPTMTPQAADGVRLKPRRDLTSRINRQRPDIVVLCGRLALDSLNLQKLRSSTICLLMQHPAFRTYSLADEKKKAKTLGQIIGRARAKP